MIPELKVLNIESFRFAIDKCIKEEVEFVLIAGDLFDSAYPSIDTLKQAFEEFKKLYEKRIPVFLIAGSHDYSVSGKTFLEVLEKSGFCTNVFKYEEKEDSIILQPTIYKNIAIYGYPGKKSGLEVNEIDRIKLQDSPGLFKILMLHTAIRSAAPNPLIKAVEDTKLPEVDYLALGHLHINYENSGKVYPGPTFPNNMTELEELKGGSFCIFNNGRLEKQKIQSKEIYVLSLEVESTLNITERAISLLENENLEDKVVILKLFGIVTQGKIADIDFARIESIAKSKKAFAFLKSTSKLHLQDSEIEMTSQGAEDLEATIIKKFIDKNPGKFNPLIHPLIRSLYIEKLDDEKSSIFEERLLSETKKVLSL